MANPAHIKIVEKGKRAIYRWQKQLYCELKKYPRKRSRIYQRRLNLRNADFSGYRLSGVDLYMADLTEAKLEEANLGQANLACAILHDANLKNARLRGTSFAHGLLSGANFEKAVLVNASLVGAHAEKAILRKTALHDADLRQMDLSGADLTEANLTRAQLLEAHLCGATLDGINMYGTGTDMWDITGVTCRYFFWRGERIPDTGYLRPGEFENRFKSGPTVEFLFSCGMSALDPALLGTAISEINSQYPQADLGLLSVNTKEGIPNAIIELGGRLPKDHALRLVSTFYEQKLKQCEEVIRTHQGYVHLLEDMKEAKLSAPPKRLGSTKKKRRRRKSSQPTARQLEAFSLVHVRGLTFRQAAIEMGCTPQNVSKLLRIAEEKVRADSSRSINFSKTRRLPTGKDGESLI